MMTYKVVKVETYYIEATDQADAQNRVSDLDNSAASMIKWEIERQ